VERLFRQVEVTDQANERREDAARLGSIESLDLGSNPVGRVLRPRRSRVAD
jgi:hypothetical protein